MKIISVDNFDREGPGHDDRFIIHISNRFRSQANEIVRLLNETVNPDGPVFYRLVENDYKLRTFQP